MGCLSQIVWFSLSPSLVSATPQLHFLSPDTAAHLARAGGRNPPRAPPPPAGSPFSLCSHLPLLRQRLHPAARGLPQQHPFAGDPGRGGGPQEPRPRGLQNGSIMASLKVWNGNIEPVGSVTG